MIVNQIPTLKLLNKGQKPKHRMGQHLSKWRGQ